MLYCFYGKYHLRILFSFFFIIRARRYFLQEVALFLFMKKDRNFRRINYVNILDNIGKGLFIMVTFNDNKQLDEHDYKGLSTDTKPTDCAVNSLFLELDTGDFYYFDGTTWNEVGA